jgi:hypothetical protein
MEDIPQSFPPLERSNNEVPKLSSLPQLPAQITWSRTFQVWWSYIWRTGIYALVADLLIETVAQVAGRGRLFDTRTVTLAAKSIVWIGASLLALKQALDTHGLRD